MQTNATMDGRTMERGLGEWGFRGLTVGARSVTAAGRGVEVRAERTVDGWMLALRSPAAWTAAHVLNYGGLMETLALHEELHHLPAFVPDLSAPAYEDARPAQPDPAAVALTRLCAVVLACAALAAVCALVGLGTWVAG